MHLRSLRSAVALVGVAASLAVTGVADAKTVTVKGTKAVTLKVGDKLVVDVFENPSTGYAWTVKARPSLLKLTSSKYTPDPQSPEAPPVAGSGGRRVFTFTALRKGAGTLRLVYQRSFAPSASDDKVTIAVKVK